MGWPFTPPEKPMPVAWVSQGFMGSQSAQKKNRIEERYDGSRHLDDVSYIVYCHK